MPESQSDSRERVLAIARQALRQESGGGPGVIDLLARAIATGEGRRATVEAASRELFGDRRPLDLVLFDTDRIAEYVFESSRPPVIAGASTLLREINAEVRRRYPDEVLFSGGGEGLLLARAGRGAEIEREIVGLYTATTGGALTATVGVLAVAPHHFVADGGEETAAGGVRVVSGTQAVLARLRDAVRGVKDGRPPDWTSVPGIRERCVSCRDRAGDRRWPVSFFREEERGLLCDPCNTRWTTGKRVINGISFDEVIATYQERIADQAQGSRAKTSYLGFLYTDGNAMGQLFGKLRSLAELRFLSLAVADVFEAAESEARRLVGEGGPVSDERDLPFVSYLGGGDEAIWIVPAALAVAIAEKLPGWLERGSRRYPDLGPLLSRAGVPRLTVGSGLVLSRPGYPIRYQYELAKALQKSAKGLFTAGPASDSSLDFELLTDSSPLSEDLRTMRETTYATDEKDFQRTCRPFTAERFDELLDAVRAAEEKQVARSQLQALQAGSREGRAVFLNFLRYQIARKPAGPRYQEWLRARRVAASDPATVERFFVRPIDGTARAGTWITDAIELSPFIERRPAAAGRR